MNRLPVMDTKECHGRIERSAVNSPPPAKRGLGAWLWRRPQRWFLLGIPAGGLIAFIVGIVFTGGFVGGSEVGGNRQVLHVLPRDAAAVPGTHAEAFITPTSSAFRRAAATATCPRRSFRACCGTLKPAPRCGVTSRASSSTPAKFEAHRLELAQKIWTELKGERFGRMSQLSHGERHGLCEAAADGRRGARHRSRRAG